MSRLPTIALALLCTCMAGCANNEHTVESTEDLSAAELNALCDDLRMRANMDCQWNMRDQQSAPGDQQSWEINCAARRDSARRSYDNVCLPWRLRPEGNPQPED